jgi:hypothetical protein
VKDAKDGAARPEFVPSLVFPMRWKQAIKLSLAGPLGIGVGCIFFWWFLRRGGYEYWPTTTVGSVVWLVVAGGLAAFGTTYFVAATHRMPVLAIEPGLVTIRAPFRSRHIPWSRGLRVGPISEHNTENPLTAERPRTLAVWIAGKSYELRDREFDIPLEQVLADVEAWYRSAAGALPETASLEVFR